MTAETAEREALEGEVLEDVEEGDDVEIEIEHPNGQGSWHLSGEVVGVDDQEPLTVNVATAEADGLDLVSDRVELFAWYNEGEGRRDNVTSSFVIEVDDEDESPTRTGRVLALERNPDEGDPAPVVDDVVLAGDELVEAIEGGREVLATGAAVEIVTADEGCWTGEITGLESGYRPDIRVEGDDGRLIAVKTPRESGDVRAVNGVDLEVREREFATVAELRVERLQEEDVEDDIPTDGNESLSGFGAGAEDDVDETIEVTLGPGPSVDVERFPPIDVLENYPNEKKGDDPKSHWLSDLSSLVAEEVGPALDDLEIGTTLGAVEVMGWRWHFAKADALEADDVDDREPITDDERFTIDEDSCRALVKGEQCGNGLTSPKAEDGLCGTHAKASMVRRVDELPGRPYSGLMSDLSDVGMGDQAAWKMAAITPSREELWVFATSLLDVDLDGETIEGSLLGTWAKYVGRLDEVDPRGHPLSFQNCAAIIPSGQFGENYQCRTNHYGTRLLCGQHRSVEPDVEETVFGEHGPDTPDFPLLEIDGEEYLGIEPRDEDLIAIDLPEYDVVRLEGEGDRMTGYALRDGSEENNETLSTSDAGADQEGDVDDRPELLADLDAGDEVVVTTADGWEYAGDVLEVGDRGFTGGQEGITVLLDEPAGARNVIWLRSEVDEEGEWEPPEAVEYNVMGAGEVELGEIVDVRVLEEVAVLLGAGASTIRAAIENGEEFVSRAPVTVLSRGGSTYVGHVWERRHGTHGLEVVIHDREKDGTLVLEAGESDVDDVVLAIGDAEGDIEERIGPVDEFRVGNVGGKTVTSRQAERDSMPTQPEDEDADAAVEEIAEERREALQDEGREAVLEEIAALIAEGMSGLQALDYYAVERLGYTQTGWAEECGRLQQSVSRALIDAKEILEANEDEEDENDN